MEMGIPFSKHPKSLVFDYKVDMPNVNYRVKSTGFSSKSNFRDMTMPWYLCFFSADGKIQTAISMQNGWQQEENISQRLLHGQTGIVFS